MRPEKGSNLLLGVTRSKAKMYEYAIPTKHHIKIREDPRKLFPLSIGLLGDLAARSNHEDTGPGVLAQLSTNVPFSARFFDAFLHSRLDTTLDAYVILFGAASYYLCDLPGSSMVLAHRLGEDCPDLESEGLEDLLLWLLQCDLSFYFEGSEGSYGHSIDSVSEKIVQFFEDGSGADSLIDAVNQLRARAYESGTPRQLLFSDVISAVVRKKIHNSSWTAIPQYSGLSTIDWWHVLQKDSFIRELWPAQHLLGQAGVLKGQSAVVQMPTSAGKTRATEIVIRSAFLAKRTALSIIVAPFRALCHEIKNSLLSAFEGEDIKVDELTDTFQTDFEIEELLGHRQVIIVTPEKLLYALRHAPELASHVGLAIFDEGHQFDSGTRGITYELLLTSLRSLLPKEAQKLLVSAVISNAGALGEWLNDDPTVVAGADLNPTFRSIGFASWLDRLGRIEFVANDDPDRNEYFVPRVIEQLPLQKRKRERRDRFFPDKANKQTLGKEIALYLGLKLSPEGSVAVFCGRKDTASGLLATAVERFSRKLPMGKPAEFSDEREVSNLTHLIASNLGSDAPATKSAQLGVFSHHGNTPHGIRLAVEHAMREGLVRFVVCTSTLAQGVNLPIRYLIVTGIYQGSQRIKVRDFHNLIGRAGRAGMHTEGSVLFADPIVYDKKQSRSDGWRWRQVKELLEPANSEPCLSNLLSIFDPLRSDDGRTTIKMEALDFAKAYIDKPHKIPGLAETIARRHGDNQFTKKSVEHQIALKIDLISSIESFLLSHWNEEGALADEVVVGLAEDTLAFFLADEPQKENIRELFKLLADNISASIEDPIRRKAYGRTLYGVQDSKAIDEWVQSNIARLLATDDLETILDVIWPLLRTRIKNRVFQKLDKPDVLQGLAREWIDGKPFHALLKTIQKREAKLIWGAKRRKLKIDHIVDLCEGGLAYDGTLLISAVTEFSELIDTDNTKELIHRLHLFQKQLKYGLRNEAAISLYELGFSDRVIASDLAASLNLTNQSRGSVIRVLKDVTGQ